MSLPKWLMEALPEQREAPILSPGNNDGVFTVKFSGKVLTFENLEEAYDYACKLTPYEDVSIQDFPESEQHFGAFYVGDADERGSKRILLSNSDQERLESLQEEYKQWLKISAKYRNNPENFQNALEFLSNHPMYWSIDTGVREDRRSPYEWNTTRTIKDFYPEVHFDYDNPDQPHEWCLETGESVPPIHNHFYFDPDLTAHGKTLEEAFINLAKTIVKYFHDDGTRKNLTIRSNHEHSINRRG